MADRNSGFDWRSALLFVAGALLMIRVRLIGDIFGADLALIFGTLVGFGTLRLRIPTAAYITLIMVVLWLLGAMLTDTIRESEPIDYLRGWGKILFFTNAMVAIALLSEFRIKRIIWYLIGMSIGTIGLAILSPTAYVESLPWKFGFGGPVTLLVACLVSLRTGGGWRSSTLMLVGIGLFSFTQGARSLGGFAISAALSFLLLSALHRRGERKGIVAVVALLCLVGASGLGVMQVYAWSAERGDLGQEAKAKFDGQTGTDLAFLLAGRSESLISTRAILDSPIIGHGSWARNRDYVTAYQALLRQHGVRALENRDKYGDVIPSHSYILGTWVEAGILAGAFWIWCLALIGRCIFLIAKNEASYSPLSIYVIYNLTWNILFSPFGTTDKTVVAGYVIFMVATLYSMQSSPGRAAEALARRSAMAARGWSAPPRQRLNVARRA